jgi:Phosphotransferase enzyme family
MRDSVGPVNDLTFLCYPHRIPPQLCGPFDSEHQFLAAFAFLGYPPTRAGTKLGRWAFAKTLEVYDVVASLYRQWSSQKLFTAHGDLSGDNILIDPDTGAIIDWEMTGFCPAWLSVVAAGWFNDDSECFLMTDDQNVRGDYSNETPHRRLGFPPEGSRVGRRALPPPPPGHRAKSTLLCLLQ